MKEIDEIKEKMEERASFIERSIHAIVAQEKQVEFARKPILTLGEIILLLKVQPPDNIVEIDFTKAKPTDLDSYRGYYEDLSLDYEIGAQPMTVVQLLAKFEGADGKTFQGYKGGDFFMHHKTQVWVSQYGMCSERMLVGIKSEGGVTTIITQEDED